MNKIDLLKRTLLGALYVVLFLNQVLSLDLIDI